ncbi:MAG: hypothetical protein ACK4TA_07800 [Saprospiraceae bacterium]
MKTMQFFKLICLTLIITIVASSTGFCQYKKVVGKVKVELSANSGYKVTQHTVKSVTISNAKGHKVTFVNPQTTVTAALLDEVVDALSSLLEVYRGSNNVKQSCSTATTVTTTTKPDGSTTTTVSTTTNCRPM